VPQLGCAADNLPNEDTLIDVAGSIYRVGVAVIGTLSSAVFLGLAAVGVLRFHKDARRQLRSIPDDAHLPPVSVLKPVHGLEAQTQREYRELLPAGLSRLRDFICRG